MSRYDPPDPICRHRPTVRISSHESLSEDYNPGPYASTYCCDRLKCQEDAKEWVFAVARVDEPFVVPLPGR